MLRGECANFRGTIALIAKVPLGNRDFGGVDSLNTQFGECVLRSGERRGGEETRELRDHRGFGEVTRPDAQIRLVGHFAYSIIPVQRRRHELRGKFWSAAVLPPVFCVQMCGASTCRIPGEPSEMETWLRP